MKIVKNIQPKIVIFTDVKNRRMLHGRVFVMCFFIPAFVRELSNTLIENSNRSLLNFPF